MKIVYPEFPDFEYKKEAQHKDLIVLHHTVSSSAKSAIEWWKSDQGKRKTATAFLVDKDGTTYQLFEPQYWAIHLFNHKPGGDKSLYNIERRSIGIELVNEGWLRQEHWGNRLIHKWNDGKSIYNGKVVTYRPAWRYESFWAEYPEAQQIATAQLVKKLCKEFAIRTDVLTGYDYSKSFLNYKGVCSHHNLVSSKTDVSVAFDLLKLQEFLNASS